MPQYLARLRPRTFNRKSINNYSQHRRRSPLIFYFAFALGMTATCTFKLMEALLQSTTADEAQSSYGSLRPRRCVGDVRTTIPSTGTLYGVYGYLISTSTTKIIIAAVETASTWYFEVYHMPAHFRVFVLDALERSEGVLDLLAIARAAPRSRSYLDADRLSLIHI